MRVRTILVVFLALVFGLSAAIGINFVATRGQEPPPTKTVPVVVAVQDIASFTKLGEELLTTREYPEQLVPPGTFTKVEEVKGRVTLARLVTDEPVLKGKISAEGEGPGIAAIIEPGMRAVTIRVRDEAAGVAGLLEPGNKVDVLLTIKNGTMDTSTTTLLQRVTLLAVGKKLEPSTGTGGDTQMFRSATLLVTPEDGAKLELGATVGQLHLILRNPLDDKDTPAKALARDIQFFSGPPKQDDLLKLVGAEVEKARDEMAKQLEAMRKKLEEAEAKNKEPAKLPRMDLPPIRTIRGVQEGGVVLRGF